MNADPNKSLTLDRRDPFGALVREVRPRAAAGDGFPQRRASSDISDAFATLWQRKWLFLAATCALFALFLVLIVRMPSKYAAEAKLLVTDQGAFSVSPTSQTATVANEQTLGTQRQILASRAVLYRVIEGLPEALAQQLAVSPEPSLLDRLLAEANDLFGREPSSGIDLPLAAPEAPPSDDLEQQYQTIASNLGSEVVLDTNVISVSYQDRQPEVAVFLVNEIVREYERFSAERRRDNAEASMAWIQEEVDALRERVQAGEQLIADYRMEAAAGTGQSSSDLVSQVGEMGLQIARARQEVARRQASLDAIAAGGVAAISSGLPGSDLYSQVLDNLVDQKLALELQLTGIVDEFGPQHPTYRTVQGGLARVQQGIDAEITRIRTNVETELAQAEAELLSLEAGLSGLSQTRAALETSELTIQDLQRQVSADRNALDQMFLLSSQYSLIGATRGVDVEVLSTAVKASNTPRPNKKLLSVAAFFVAGTMALVLVFAVDFSRKLVSRPDHLAMVGVGRYFGQVSSIGCPSVRKLVERVRKRKLTRPLVRAVEQVGQILIRAEDEVQHNGALTIAVTSYAHNEGKSTLAFLMALVAGQINSRALLIDMDLRASSLQAIWPNAEQGGIGVGDFAAEPSARAQLGIVRTGLGFDYIGPGNCVGSPAGLIKSFLSSDAFRMCQDYDVIIIDSAPVGPVADSHHLFGIADCVAFSVMAGQTRIANVAKAMDEIPRVGLHKVRFVMNGVRRKTSSDEHEYLTPIAHG